MDICDMWSSMHLLCPNLITVQSGLNHMTISHLQLIQNSTARLLTNSGPYLSDSCSTTSAASEVWNGLKFFLLPSKLFMVLFIKDLQRPASCSYGHLVSKGDWVFCQGQQFLHCHYPESAKGGSAVRLWWQPPGRVDGILQHHYLEVAEMEPGSVEGRGAVAGSSTVEYYQ